MDREPGEKLGVEIMTHKYKEPFVTVDVPTQVCH